MAGLALNDEQESHLVSQNPKSKRKSSAGEIHTITSSRSESIKPVAQSTWLDGRKRIQLNREGSEDDYVSVLEIFTKLKWTVYRVSPLFGFEDTEIRLKQYALRLRNHFVNQNVSEDVEYSTEFKMVKDVGCRRKDKIVKVAVRTSVEKSEPKVIYTGIIMSWGASESDSDQFLHLPVLMCRGRITAVQTVHEALSMLFDCVIAPLRLAQMDLIWLNSLFLSLSEPMRKNQNLVKLILHPPGKSDASCEYIMSFEHVKTIWSRVHPENSDVITAEEVKTLYEGIIEHASRTANINLTSFKIHTICYNDVTVKSTGQISCKSPEILNELLCFLHSELLLTDSGYEDSI